MGYKVIEEVKTVLNCIELKADDPDVLEGTQVDRVESLGESNLLLRTFTKGKPGKYLQIQRVLRKIFTDALLREGIVIPVRAEIVEG